MAYEVRHNDAAQRYELLDDGTVIGIADYRRGDDDTLVFPHTEIASDRRGRGLGEQLVSAALDDVRRRNYKVHPACWFVRDFMRDNPQYADLRA